MGNRPAEITQADIRRVFAAAKSAGVGVRLVRTKTGEWAFEMTDAPVPDKIQPVAKKPVPVL